MYALRTNQGSPLSPISSLPVELLSEIFTLCALAAGEPSPSSDDAEYSPPIVTTDSLRATLLLSSVNRKWRDVVLHQPNLWSNLCITAELISQTDDEDGIFASSPQKSSSRFNASYIIACLQRSRQCPINIFIDARDEEWNFTEPDVGIDFGEVHPPPLFSSEHMSTVVSLLLPHLSRWGSLTVLTDTWAPMHTALTAINPHINAFGAPLLESVTLMRCNDFVSFSTQFQPRRLKNSAFLSRDATDVSEAGYHILPRLKHLCLRGVHADWNSLATALGRSPAALSYLELQSHCADVRPSVEQFHQLLSSTPALRKLVVTGSGPELPDDDTPRDCDPVHLPQLHNITVGYRSASEGRLLLKLLDAPNARSLTLEDSTYPGDPEEINGGSLLTYLGSKESHSHENEFRVIYDLPQGVHYSVAVEAHNKTSKCPHSRRSSFKEEPRPAFPLLRNVTLKSVKASPRPMRTFFHALPHLQHLELIGMSMQAVHALLPSTSSTSLSSNCPCPQLRSLSIKGSDQLQVQDLDFIVGNLAIERQSKGACGLQEVDIHVDAARAASVAAAVSPASPGMKVTIVSDGESDEEDEVDIGDLAIVDSAEEASAYMPGGIFNDPFFDAYYSARLAAR
ncbi:hypothetical protein M413DRAFT_443738 [Hebeloma cylindrosporum]|uniref:Uncharacterized protein n=1 Tax=Hebeloma cylindrosporum TaxID=76867 RepID=A0A0C2YS52_HEBCY|nr:hypothetical protein M413DRAFT_443738 [Hebeloma cylindrosporum h7]